MVQIMHTKIINKLPDNLYKELLNKIPIQLQEKNARFVRWQDRHAHLFGKVLLQELLMQFGYDQDCLHNILYTQYNRPYIEGNIDFNISHSGEYVVCVAAEAIKTGIDIEKIRAIDFDNFKNTMTNEQWKEIEASNHPVKTFFNYWSLKESVIKADGRGLNISLKNIQVRDNTVRCNNQLWYLKELNIDSNYSTYLTTSIKRSESDVKLRYKAIEV